MRIVAELVEEYELESLFLGEHTHTPVATVQPDYPDGLPEFYKRFLDPFVQLTVAATVTDRIRIGTGVVLVAERNPLELAKAVASLDLISNGRVELGVGFGWNPLELMNNGIDPKRRRDVYREKMQVLRQLWTQDVVAFEGTFVSFTASWSYPKPVQKPHPPVLIGAGASRATFSDVVEYGDGWYPLGSPEMKEHVAQLTERSGGTLPPISVVEMEGQRPGAPWYIDDRQLLDQLTSRAKEYATLGIHRTVVGVPTDDADRLRTALEALNTLSSAVA